jgi:hypothetical protein
MTFGCLEALAVVYTPLLAEQALRQFYKNPTVIEIVVPQPIADVTLLVVGLAILIVTTIWCVLTTTTEVATPTEVAGTMVTSVAPTNTEVGEVRAENCSSIRSTDFFLSLSSFLWHFRGYVGPANNCVIVLFIKVYQVCADNCFPILFIKVYYVGVIDGLDLLGEIRVAPTNTEVEEIRVAPTNTEVVEGYHLYTIPEESSEDPTGACDAMVASVAPTNTEVEEIRVAPTNTEVVEETSTPKVVFVILHNEIVMMPYWDNNGMWLTGHNGMWLTGQELFMHIKTIKDTTTGTEFNITKENTHGWSVVVPDQEGVFPQPYFYLEKAFSYPHNRDLRMYFNGITVHGPNIAEKPEPVRRCTLV